MCIRSETIIMFHISFKHLRERIRGLGCSEKYFIVKNKRAILFFSSIQHQPIQYYFYKKWDCVNVLLTFNIFSILFVNFDKLNSGFQKSLFRQYLTLLVIAITIETHI